MVIFRLSKNTLVWVRILPRLGENTLESTFAPGAFSPRRLYPHLGETTLSPRRDTTRLGENSPENIFTPRNHSRLGELCRKHNLSDNLCRFYYHSATTHVSND